jgi:hypothetical protein
MPRRKKRKNFKFILIALAIAGGVWVAADFWFNVWRAAPKEVGTEEAAAIPVAPIGKPATSSEEVAPALENGFKSEIYRDAALGFELRYPAFAGDDVQCPKLEKTADGFSLGMFSFLVVGKQGNLDEFIASELQGMAADDKKTIMIDGNPATKIDYQAGGMGWYGSTTFIEYGGKFFEFGLLANESSAKCGGIDDYEDRVYQSVISTLKFAN